MPEASNVVKSKWVKIYISMKKTDKVSWSLLSDKFVQQISLQDSGIGKMCMPDTGNQEKQDKPQKPLKLYHFL